MAITPMKTAERSNTHILDAIFKEIATLNEVVASLQEENRDLREALEIHEGRLNNLTLNIPDATVNAITARVLHTHAQVLIAATSPQPAPQPQMVEEVEEEETEELEEIEG